MDTIYSAGDYVFTYLGVVRENKDIFFQKKRLSILLNEPFKALALKCIFYRHYPEKSDYRESFRIAIFKDKDYNLFQEAFHNYSKWKNSQNDSKFIRIDEKTHQKILNDFYLKEYLKQAEEFSKKVICYKDFDYSMPAETTSEEVTVEIPVSPDMFDTNTQYHIVITKQDYAMIDYKIWPSFNFFDFGQPIQKTILPVSASFGVVSRSYSCKITRYRHYADFYSDIHYHPKMLEVNDNPPILMFDFKYQSDSLSYPALNLKLISGETNIYEHTLQALCTTEHMINAFVCLDEDIIREIKKNKELTAIISCFGQELTRCSFRTDITEKGKYLF